MNRVLGIIVLSLGLLSAGCSTGKPLFNGKDLAGWVEVGSKEAWSVQSKDTCPVMGPILKCSGQKTDYAWLSTDRKYGDFEMTLQWRVQADGNTGVFCRAPDREGRTSTKGFEIQARDDSRDENLIDVSGCVFNRIPATDRFAKPPGQWNNLKVTCQGRHVRIELNGRVTVDADMDKVPAKGNDPPMKNVPNEGYIGLQNHGTPAEFRGIRIQEITAK